MIQRQQTLWLLLSAVCSFLSFQFPFYLGSKIENEMSVFAELEAGSNLFLLLLTGISLLLAVVTIFLFKERKKQLKFAIAGIVISVILLVIYITQLKNFTNGHFALTAVFVLGIPLGYILAARGIWKDEKLVKSLDKLR
jgi:hypothetical protein